MCDQPVRATAPTVKGQRDLDEVTLVVRAQDGDMEAFEVLVRRYQGSVYRLARRTLGDRPEAEDIVQDTLLEVWRRLPTLQHPGAFRTWVYRAASNKCLDLLRAQHRRPETSLDPTASGYESAAGLGSPAGSPEQVVSDGIAVTAVAQAVAELPPEVRLCWVLREIEEVSYREIAQIIGTTETTVRGRIARARRTIAERMANWR